MAKKNMKAISVINGVLDNDLHEMIERFAFLKGISTCDLETFLAVHEQKWEDQYVLLYIDLKGLSSLTENIIYFLYMEYPVIIVPTCRECAEIVFRKYGGAYPVTQYPFSKQIFSQNIRLYAGGEMDRKRILQFGTLCIDQYRKQITVNGREIQTSGYEYEIFLVLIQHMGEVLSREKINQHLPERQRETVRNIDTHIKNIRRKIGDKEIIKCVRSVGYCIPENHIIEKFGTILP